MQRILSLDIARAICIILVVIGHYYPENSPGWYDSLHGLIYSFHMPLFMFASGYVYMATNKERNYGKFVWKKVKRLMIPYVVTSFIVITLKLLMEGNAYVQNPVSLDSYLRVFYGPEAGFFLWFIWALWLMFLIVPLFRTKKSRLVLLAVAAVFAYVPLTLTEVFCIDKFRDMFVFFMLGAVAFDVQKSGLPIWERCNLPVTTVLFVVLEGLFLFADMQFLAYVLPYVGICFVLRASSAVAVTGGRVVDWLVKVSGLSYIIYLFHTTFEGLAKAVLLKVPGWSAAMADGWMFGLGAMAVVLAGVVFPMLMGDWVLKRSRVLRFLFGLK